MLGLLADAEAFFAGYLAAYVFWLGLALGSLAVLMLRHLVKGEWGFLLQRHLEAAALAVIPLAVLFLPILLGRHALYPWADAARVAADALLQHRRPYLNAPFFAARAVVYFAAWIALAVLLRRWGLRVDQTEDLRWARRLRALAAGGLIALVLLHSLAMVDWVMALEAAWSSTVFGWLLLVSGVLAAFAVAVLALGRLCRRPPLDALVRTKHFHDLGNFLLTFVMMWAYLILCQYLIIWAGDKPEEVVWYVERQRGVWAAVGPLLVVFHFAVPFALLLSRRTKRSVRALSTVAVGLLAMHALYVLWLVLPSVPGAGAAAFWIYAAALVGLGGVWTAAYTTALARQPLLPRIDQHALGAARFEDVQITEGS